MALNDGFRIPRKTQKVTAVTPTTILQYTELIGNLPGRRKFADRVPADDADEIIGQAFSAPADKLKAIGVYLQVDFRPQGQRRVGTVLLKFWHWPTYPVFSPVEVVYAVSGRTAEVEIDIENIVNLNETIFEFEEYIALVIGDTYFFTVTQPEGWSEKRPIYVASSGLNYGPTQGDFWIWNRATVALSRQQVPITDMVFDSYQSITELAVNLVGSGSGNLTDIQDALTIGDGTTADPRVHAGYGVIDYNKPFLTHGQAVIDPTTVYGNAPITIGVHGGFSAVGDLRIEMKVVGAVDDTFVTGPNDMTAQQVWTPAIPTFEPVPKDMWFKITIKTQGAGPPDDTFDWEAYDNEGTVLSSAADVVMAASNTLYQGVTIDWASTSGHTVADYWVFYVAAWDFAIVRVATDRIRMDWGDPTDTLDCSDTGSFRLMEEGDAVIIPEFISQFSFRKHSGADDDPTISITLWRTDRP